MLSPNEGSSGTARRLSVQNTIAPALSLDEQGAIKDCTKPVLSLFGFSYEEVIGQNVSLLFPQLLDVELVKGDNVNPLLSYLTRCGYPYEASNRSGNDFFCHLTFIRVELFGTCSLRVLIKPTEDPLNLGAFSQ
jgi:PAS domain S-box-containing protein